MMSSRASSRSTLRPVTPRRVRTSAGRTPGRAARSQARRFQRDPAYTNRTVSSRPVGRPASSTRTNRGCTYGCSSNTAYRSTNPARTSPTTRTRTTKPPKPPTPQNPNRGPRPTPAPTRPAPKPRVDISRIQQRSLDRAVAVDMNTVLQATVQQTVLDPGDLVADYSKALYADTAQRYEFSEESSNPIRRDDCAKGKTAIHYRPLDQYGRAQGAYACLNRGDFNYMNDRGDWAFTSNPTTIVGTGTEFPISWDHIPQGYYGGGILHRGHLLARQLGGDGDDLRNLVPLYADVNTPLMRGYEDAIAARIKNGETVYYQVIPHYEGKSRIPDYLTLSWHSQRGGSASVRLDNVP